jgi:hypothetical protein
MSGNAFIYALIALVMFASINISTGTTNLEKDRQTEADLTAAHAQYLPLIMNRFGEPGLAALGPAGGNVSLASASGAIALAVPAGALSSTTSIQLTAIPATSGSLMQFVMTPADLIFAKSITLQVSLAGSAPLANGLVIYLGSLDNPVYLPTTIDPTARTLTAVLTLFPPAPDATQAFGKAGIGPAALATAAGNAGVTQVTCAQVQGAADQALQKLKAHPFDTDVIRAAVEAQYQIGASIEACGDLPSFQQWSRDTEAFLRAQHNDALVELFAASTNVDGAIEKAARRVYAWCAELQVLIDSTSCPDEELLVRKFEELGNEYAQRLDTAQQPTEMQPVMPRLYHLMGLVQALGLQKAETHLLRAMNNIFNKMADLAEQRCVPQANLEWLASQLTPLIETTEETLHRKIVTCSVQLRIDSQDSAGAVSPESVTYAKGAASATNANTFLEGKLILSGSAFALRCSRVAGDASPSDAFSLRAFGNEIKRFNHNGLAFDFAQTLDVQGIFKTLGLNTDGDEPLQLEFWRTGIRIDCGEGDVFEMPEQKLFIVNYDAIAAGITVSPTETSLNAGQQQSFKAVVKGFVDTSAQWSASGGSITQGGLFSAGTVSGTFGVIATSVASPTLQAGATVRVKTAAQPTPAVVLGAGSFNVMANALTQSLQLSGPDLEGGQSLSVVSTEDSPPPPPVGTALASSAGVKQIARSSAQVVQANTSASFSLTGLKDVFNTPGISGFQVQGSAEMDATCCGAESSTVITFTVLRAVNYTINSEINVEQPVFGQNLKGVDLSLGPVNLTTRGFGPQTFTGTLQPGVYLLRAKAIHYKDEFCIGCLIQGKSSYNVTVSFSPSLLALGAR